MNVGNETVAITLTSTGLPNASVTATVTDDDVLSFVLSSATPTLVEYSTVVVTVRLSNQPLASVSATVSIPTGGTHASVSTTSLTFTTSDWNEPKTVSVVSPPGQPASGPGGADYAHSAVTTKHFGGGGEEYWLFLPADPQPPEAPVVVFLHG
ncbi:MAG: hypothetical protein AAB131_15195, partial [Actinomycetota bacterium]